MEVYDHFGACRGQALSGAHVERHVAPPPIVDEDAHGDEGPDLYNLHKSDARIHQVITAGIKGEMPSFGKKLRDPDVRAITAYLRTLRANTGIDGSHAH